VDKYKTKLIKTISSLSYPNQKDLKWDVGYRFDKERLIEEFLMIIRTNIIDAYGDRLVSIALFGSVSRKRYTKGVILIFSL
jgi:hypothetical protein